MFSVPRETRLRELLEPGAVLLSRFGAEDWEEAKQIYERFLDEDYPDNLELLNIPIEAFLLHRYPCGFSAGEKVTFRKPYMVSLADGCVWERCPGGLEAVILPGDTDYPDVVFLETVETKRLLHLQEAEAQQVLERVKPHPEGARKPV